MAKQTINLGTAPNGAGGDTFRSALVKAQANMDELYNAGVAVTALTGLASVDMNTFTTAGVYLFNNPSANSPGFDYGTIEVQPRVAAEIIQIARSIVSDVEVSRRYLGGSWSAWRRNYHTGSILGSVSQSAGVPTGSVIETGSTSNGTYTKFADGTMICTSNGSNLVSANLSANTSSLFTLTLPAVFTNASYSVSAVAGPASSNDHYGVTNAYAASTGTAGLIIRNGGTAQSFAIRYIAIGRWF